MHAAVPPYTMKCAETGIDRTDHFAESPAPLLLVLLSQVISGWFVGILCKSLMIHNAESCGV